MVWPGFCLCFAGDTLVTTRHGAKRIDSIEPMDEILTIRKTDGTQKWTPFLIYIHKDDHAEAEFIILHLSSGITLRVTGDHLVYVEGYNGKQITKIARNIKEGDKMFASSVKEDGSGPIFSAVNVEKITYEKGTGIYAPLTFSGDFLANGILVTCYATVEHFQVAHTALAPLRMWKKISRKPKPNHTSHGIHVYAKVLMNLREQILAPFTN